MTMLDPSRFDQLPDTEVLRRIGGIVAQMVDHGRWPAPPPSAESPEDFSELDLIADATDRAIATYLTRYGAATVKQLASELAKTEESIGRAICRLRGRGICDRIGRTSAARYRLRRDFSEN